MHSLSHYAYASPEQRSAFLPSRQSPFPLLLPLPYSKQPTGQRRTSHRATTMYRCFHEQAEFSHPQIQQLSYPLLGSGNLFRCKTDHKPWQREYLSLQQSFPPRFCAALHNVLYRICLFRIAVLPAQCFEYELRNLTMHHSSSIPLKLSGESIISRFASPMLYAALQLS